MDRSGQVARRDRYRLREVLWDVSSIEACRKCGRIPVAVAVTVEVNGEGKARYGGLASCSSVWCCPVCSFPIRRGRAAEIELGLSAAFESGGGALFSTFTVPHSFGDGLGTLLLGVKDSWAALVNGRFGMMLREEFGVIGHIRSVEVTFGPNGWHPHLHVVFVFEVAPDEETMLAFDAAMFDRYVAAAVRAGLGEPSREHGLVTKLVLDGSAVADYVAKLERDLIGAALEIAMSNVKKGRGEHLAPFELLGQASFDGPSANRWRNYEQSFRGTHAVRWSPGLKSRLHVVDRSDDELVAGEGVGYEPVLLIDGRDWLLMCRKVRGFQGALLDAVEAHGAQIGSHVVSMLLTKSMEVAA